MRNSELPVLLLPLPFVTIHTTDDGPNWPHEHVTNNADGPARGKHSANL